MGSGVRVSSPRPRRLVRAFSSVGQSGRLITGWSKVRVLEGPPNVKKSKNIYGLVVQLVRTLACHARGRGFDPHPGRHSLPLTVMVKGKTKNALVAQSVEQGTENPSVGGSIPP